MKEKRRTSEFEQPSRDPCCRNFENWKVTHSFDPLGFLFLLLVWFPLLMGVLEIRVLEFELVTAENSRVVDS